MSQQTKHILKSHNKTLLLYNVVLPAKYRRKVFTKEVEKELIQVCKEISERFEIHYVEIGTDEDHVHFLIQSVPTFPVTEIVRKTKSITAREIFDKREEVKGKLWGGNFWTSGYYANTVGKYGNEEVIRDYVKNQGQAYTQLHREQLMLFEGLA